MEPKDLDPNFGGTKRAVLISERGIDKYSFGETRSTFTGFVFISNLGLIIIYFSVAFEFNGSE